MSLEHLQYIFDEAQKRTAVVVPADEWDQIIEQLEELEDIRAYDAARARTSERIPLEQAIREIEEAEKG